MASKNKEFDIVIYGATGFTGFLILEYLCKNLRRGGRELRIAIAGRNREKLEATKNRIASPEREQIGILIADNSDLRSLNAMAAAARVIIDAVGPYMVYGEPVVRACVENKAHYVDLTGEPAYFKMLCDKYDDAAKKNGVALIPCCGFDSIPPDIATFVALSKLTEEDKTQGVVTVDVYGKMQNARVSSGTIRSLIEIMCGNAGLSLRSMHYRPYPHYNVRERVWGVPTPTSDVIVLQRTHQLLSRSDIDLGKHLISYPLQLRPSAYVGFDSVISVIMVIMLLGILLVISYIPGVKSFLSKRFPPGNGPSAEQRSKVRFKTTARVTVEHKNRNLNKTITCVIRGGDGGYTQTAQFISECAIMLATELESHPLAAQGGLLTPASAFGFALVDRLKAIGIEFDQ